MSAQRIPAALRAEIGRRAAGGCEYCRVHEDDVAAPHEPDHVIAEQHGGPAIAANLALACYHCNRFNPNSDIETTDDTDEHGWQRRGRGGPWKRFFPAPQRGNTFSSVPIRVLRGSSFGFRVEPDLASPRPGAFFDGGWAADFMPRSLCPTISTARQKNFPASRAIHHFRLRAGRSPAKERASSTRANAGGNSRRLWPLVFIDSLKRRNI